MTTEQLCTTFADRLAATAPAERLTAAVDLLTAAFALQPDEVALFACRNYDGRDVLRFLWPPHLAAAPSGYVPLSSDHSLAVRTFLEDRPYINLLFSTTPHASYFELLPVDRQQRRPPPIQNIISAPLRVPGGFQGVVQLSHKAADPTQAPDFRAEDLELLAALARVIAAYL